MPVVKHQVPQEWVDEMSGQEATPVRNRRWTMEAYVLTGSPNKRRPWTTRDDELLAELRAKHVTYAQIGQILGRSVHAVNRRTQRLNIAHHRHRQPPVWTDAKIAILIRGYATGLPIGKIAAQTDRGWKAVQCKAQHLGLTKLFPRKRSRK